MRRTNSHRRRGGRSRVPRQAAPSGPITSGPRWRRRQHTRRRETGSAAEPRDDVSRGNWWEIFHDPQLSALDRARRHLEPEHSRRGGAIPTGAGACSAGARRATFRRSPAACRRFAASRRTFPTRRAVTRPVTTYNLPVNASWEPDLWGSVRRPLGISEAGAQASAADLASARLSARRRQLAQSYFLLRATDAQKQLLEDTAGGVRAVAAAHEEPLCGRCRGEGRRRPGRRRSSGAPRPRRSRSACSAPRSNTPSPCSSASRRRRSPSLPCRLRDAVPTIPLGRAVRAARAPAGHGRSGAQRRRGERSDRRGEAAFYPTLTLSAAGGFRSTISSNWLSGAEPLLVGRALRSRKSCSTADCARA